MGFFNKNTEVDAAMEQTSEMTELDKEIAADARDEKIREYVKALIDDIKNDKHVNITMDGKHDDEVKANVMKYAEKRMQMRAVAINLRDAVQEELVKSLWGFDRLQGLIDDLDISDIKCYGAYRTRIKKLGKRMTTDVKFDSDEDFRRFVNLIAQRNGVSLNLANSEPSFMDNTSSPDFRLRIIISMDNINSEDIIYLQIRKEPKKKKHIPKLIEEGLLDEKSAAIVRKAMKTGTGIGFCGCGGSGKTTLFNASLEEYPHDKAGLIIEENSELFADPVEEGGHPDIMFQHIVEANIEGKIQYTLKELTKKALLFDLNMIGIGEIKGDEASELAKAIYTGAFGMLTVHGMNCIDGLVKLGDYVKQSTGYDLDQCLKMFVGLQYFVFLSNYKVQEIIEIKGWNSDTHFFDYDTVYTRKAA